MSSLGNFSLMASFAFAAYACLASGIGALKAPRLIESSRHAVFMVWIFTTLAVICLLTQLLNDHFHLHYVAKYSNRDLPFFYKIAALWGGQEGSLLFWSWILTSYSALVVFQNKRRHLSLIPYVILILMGTALFFLLLNLKVANPFTELAVDHGNGLLYPYEPPDGKGLNPLLQYFAMLIHPPILYLGYIGTVVPFSFAVAALIAQHKSTEWIRTTRKWALISWALLGAGILLGAKWAYVELGWGGYWAWDPVENASLMPWLTATAFLHSVMIQEKKGMLKIWNMALVMITFIISIFGTFLTRSGVVSSVHSFAQSNIGPYFLSFIGLVSFLSLFLLLQRISFLKSENSLESIVSREAGFLLNNWILLAACFAVLWGTIFPVLSEWIQGEKITVGAPFFNKVNIPIGIILLFLTGVGPLLAWRKTSWSSIQKNFPIPILGGLISGISLWVLGVRHLYAWISLTLSAFVITSIFLEFFQGTRARMRSTKENPLTALVSLTRKNARRYGGYIVHLGIVMIFIGISGNAFNQETKKALSQGDSLSLKNYQWVCKEITSADNPNYSSGEVKLELFRNGRFIKDLSPERRFYKASEQPTSEVSIFSNLLEDLYVVFADLTNDEKKAVIQVYINPLVQWVWIGGLVIVLGTLLLLLPEKPLRKKP
ncbi:MAG: heme lyase CcmF/NrfE family subunit [Chlamydiae bacterium]|nr:heme lyase CcmF/NrfE family subunit [Chlamydiota bacterium]